MHTLLESGHAWFFDSMSHELDGTLIIRLVEGIKGVERHFVEVGNSKLGPCFPIQVRPESRCTEVRFTNAVSIFLYDESYDQPDAELNIDTGRYLFKATTSSFRKFAEATTSLARIHNGPYQEFLLCCEDRVFHVLSADAPVVSLLEERPNLAMQRTDTWSAT